MKVHFGFPGRALERGAATIGSFDGIHRGHQVVIGQVTAAVREQGGPSTVVTFDPHPRCVLVPDNCPLSLTTVDEKAAILAALGIDNLVVLEFTRQLSQLSAAEFMDRLVARLPLHDLVIGWDFALGHHRLGDRDFLERYGRQHGGYRLTAVPEQKRAEGPVSSSTVRALLLEGRVGIAARLLGRPYSITAFVEHGTRTGSRIGFPTANFAITPSKLVPAKGIYAVWVDVDGRAYQGAMNIGYRPTFGENRLTVEVFLLDFHGDLYGREVTARFVRRIRDERKFSSVDALVVQIGRDVDRVRAILSR